MTKSSFIAELADKNRRFYGTPRGRGVLRAFELTFEHRWLYLFELTQNALDAGARSVSLRLTEDGGALVFQHDGDHPLDEEAVEALSEVFRSTKSVSSTGFMGIGFKSVFGRFQEARISGWGWTFRYEITQIVGERYRDVQPDLLGAVVPLWDDTIAVPDEGFTTRFELHRRQADSRSDLESDLAYFLPDDDPALLAILAASGLQRLEVNGRRWELRVGMESDSTLEAAALSEDGNRRWRLFSVEFDPSEEAVASFLEHRRIQPSEAECAKVYAEAARPRRLLGVLPLADDGTPVPPVRGRIYATLPTDVTLPFGLHVNADWLLNISRSGLREIEDNAWQRDIVDGIADLLENFLRWVARTCSEPAAAKAAFEVLAPPSPEAGGLEALLAEEKWLSRLRTRLEDIAVLPVWTEETEALAFAKSEDTILPPPPLAQAFEDQPALRPAVLLKGPVLIDEVLGSAARALLERAGLLAELSPQHLERAWSDGLARWWTVLASGPEDRRTLLFRIWAAVAELASDDPWRRVPLPCIRTATKHWLPVKEVVFFNEPFPSEREPGGSQVRQFMQSFIPDRNRLPDGWIGALRNGKEKEGWRPGPLSQALDWIEHSARPITLREVCRNAMNGLASAPTPDWSILTPLGHWAKHRNQPALLTRVLVESSAGTRGIPTDEALLADPYVESSQGRRYWFPAKSTVSAAYLEQDPKNAAASEWRMFFERAGVKGKLEVVRTESDRISRWQRERVAEFLGLAVDKISESNDGGYSILDFDIEPKLPDSGAPEVQRRMLAAWLEDGHEDLERTGRRRAQYFFRTSYGLTGNTPSAWMTALTDLAWIPCADGELRCPRDVLPSPDAGREDAPVANLSPELLRVLQQEGMKFGTAIPEATALRKLSVVGFRLEGEELAQLLRGCREQIATDEDRRHLETVLQTLTVPAEDDQRVPLNRIVQRVGGRRGALGGWLVPMDRIDETLRAELEHYEIPYEFPDTTTGKQALAYVQDVWKRARSSPQRLANEVRDVLPTAYAYCLEDCAEDTSLADLWKTAIPEAAVFAEREWIFLEGGGDVYFDDLDDRRFFPEDMQLRIVTSGHLGNSQSAQLRTAKALALPLLSSSIEMEWYGEEETLSVGDGWYDAFDLICELLQRVRGGEGVEVGEAEADSDVVPRLKRVRELALRVSFKGEPAEAVPVNARLNERVLIVAGRPVQFGADAAKELLRHYAFGQRANLAADLTGMLGAIDNWSDFMLAAEKFRRSFIPDFELSKRFPARTGPTIPTDLGDGPNHSKDAEVDD